MHKKLLAIFLIICIVSLSFTLAGCGGENTASVYFLNSDLSLTDVYEDISKAYEKETGVKVRVVTAPEGTYDTMLESEIKTDMAPTIFEISSSLDFDKKKDHCLDLKDSKIYSYLADEPLAIGAGNSVFAIPYSIEGYGIIYNKSICDEYFKLENRDTQFNSMEEINNFSKLKQLVEDMSKHKSQLGIEGVFASTSLASDEDTRWHTHLLNIPLYYEFKDNADYADPTLAGVNSKEIALRYSGNYRNLFDLYTENSITTKKLLGSKTVDDSLEEFALGKVVMIQSDSNSSEQIFGLSGNTVRKEDIRFLPMYTGIDGEEKQGLCVGVKSYLAINKDADEGQVRASLDFLDWLFSSKVGKNYVTKELKIVTPFKTFDNDEQPDDPLAKEVIRYIGNGDTDSVPYIFASFPGENFTKSVGGALLDYVKGNRSWDEVASVIKDKWKTERFALDNVA